MTEIMDIQAMREEMLDEVCSWKDWQILAAAPSKESGEKIIAIKRSREAEGAK